MVEFTITGEDLCDRMECAVEKVNQQLLTKPFVFLDQRLGSGVITTQLWRLRELSMPIATCDGIDIDGLTSRRN